MTSNAEPWTPGDVDQPPRQEPSSFDPGILHLYRAEMHRMTVWRQRLDVTGNWAILLIVALTTFTLGTPDVPHFTLLLGLASRKHKAEPWRPRVGLRLLPVLVGLQ